MFSLRESDTERRLRLLESRLRALESREYTPRAGAWTPAFQGSAVAGTIAYTLQAGRFVRVGSLVWLTAFVVVSGISVSPTGDLQMSGLPFAVANTANIYAAVALGQYKLDLTAGKFPGAYLAPGASILTFTESQDAAAVALMPASALQTDSNIILTVVYEAEN